MDSIILKNLDFYGYHGVLESEKRLGQHFFIDAVLFLDLKKAGETDDLSHTVHYGHVFQLIERIATIERYDLIEALAERICTEILANFRPVQKIRLKIKKPEAPIEGNFEYVAVAIQRERDSDA